MAGRKPTYFVISAAGSISPLMARRAARDLAKKQRSASRTGFGLAQPQRIYQFDSDAGIAVEIGVAPEYSGEVSWHKKPKPVPAILAATIAAHFSISTEPGFVEMSNSGAA